ncbi:MAG: ABC transporter substrate-binding protein [Buchananella hordeovulneris]|nr:ABC transporter substrate-binding protein [Buchananella hordeovulneris]
MIASALALAGCASANRANGAQGAAPEGQTRIVKDIDGVEVTVPTHPARVVTLSEPTTDGALALGVHPIGVVAGRGQADVSNYLKPIAGDVPILGVIGTPNYEAIGAAKPDLILVDGTSVNNNPEALRILRQIAPVVFTGYAGGDWRVNFEIVSDALNKVEEGKAFLAGHDAKVADVSARLEAKGLLDQTFSIVRWQGNGAGLILKELPPGKALTALRMARPASQDKEGRGHSEPVSLENIDQIDADWIFFGTLGGSSVGNPQAGGELGVEASAKALEEAKQVPGFAALHAVKANQVIPVDGSVWTSTGGPLLMERIIDDIAHHFLTN